ncbi:MAG: hypothetical protein ACRDKZ_15985 [Actinomycetota bacterium]
MRRTLILVLVGALLLGACGQPGDDSQSPREVIAAAAGAMQDAGSARMAGSQQVESGQFAIDTASEGLIDFESGDAQVTMTMSGLPTGEEKIELRLIDFISYMQLPQFLRSDRFQGKDWIKIDLQKAGQQMGFDFAAMMQASRQAETALQMLKGATDVEEVGTEELRGVETTHYRYTLDLDRVIQEVPEDLKKSIQAVIDLGTGDIPGEIWVDEDGLTRKMSYEMSQSMQGQEMTQQMTLEYYDFGVDVEVEPPPASDVVDVTKMRP